MGFGGGDTNVSRYCGNSPTNGIDPFGKFDWDWGAFWGGLGQGALNTVNGVQDAGVGVLNAPSAVWNNTAGNLGAGRLSYIDSPDWSKDMVIKDDPYHNISKFAGGQGVVTLATLGTSTLVSGCATAGRASSLARGATQALSYANNTQMAAQTFDSGVRTGNALWNAFNDDRIGLSGSGSGGGVGVPVRSGWDKWFNVGKEAIPALLNIGIAAATHRNGCFAAGTLVATPHGNVPIETIKRGDLVWAYDLVVGEWRQCLVLDTFETFYSGPMARITVGGETIESTQLHPIWVVRGERLAQRPPGSWRTTRGRSATWPRSIALRTRHRPPTRPSTPSATALHRASSASPASVTTPPPAFTITAPVGTTRPPAIS